MQNPDFEIVVESNPDYAMSALYQAAAFAVVMQGAKYIRLEHEGGDFRVRHDTRIQGWRERPEGWLTADERRAEDMRRQAEQHAEIHRKLQERVHLEPRNPSIFARMKRAFCAVLVALALSFPAMAGMDARLTASTITTSSGNCLALRNERQSLSFDASGATAAIGYCYGASCTAAIGTVGTVNMGFGIGALHFWPAGSAPRGAFCFIAGSGSQPLTIIEGLQ